MDTKAIAVLGLVLLVSGCTSSTQSMDGAVEETPETEAQSPEAEMPEESGEDTMSGMDSETSSSASTEESSSSQESSTSGESENTISYTSSGFEPSRITTEPGETVTFVDQTGNGVWVGSNNHPFHRNYDGTSTQNHCRYPRDPERQDRQGNPFDSCAAVSRFSFAFNETGEYGYHNHLSAGDQGTVVVEQG
jgi:plastocyanin